MFAHFDVQMFNEVKNVLTIGRANVGASRQTEAHTYTQQKRVKTLKHYTRTYPYLANNPDDNTTTHPHTTPDTPRHTNKQHYITE